MKFIILILLLSCNSIPERIEKPVDYSETIKEVAKSPELNSNPALKEKIVRQLKESSNYSNECYDKLNEIGKKYFSIQEENEKLKKQVDELYAKLWFYWKIDIAIGVLIIGFILYKTANFWLPIVKSLITKVPI